MSFERQEQRAEVLKAMDLIKSLTGGETNDFQTTYERPKNITGKQQLVLEDIYYCLETVSYYLS